MAHSTSWIPARYGKLIPQRAVSERLTGGMSLQLITQATGNPISHRIDTASTHLLTPACARLLELDPDGPLAELVVVMTAKATSLSTAWTSEGRAVSALIPNAVCQAGRARPAPG